MQQKGIVEIGRKEKMSFRVMSEQVDVLGLTMHILKIWVTYTITLSPIAS